MKKKPLQIGLAGMMLTATVLGTPAMAVQFTDVASNHWASASISKMVDKGILKGVGDKQFAPSQSVTYGEFVAMVVRQFKGEQPTAGSGDKWYTPYWETAKTSGYLNGIASNDPNAPINRYDMALIIFNLFESQGMPRETTTYTPNSYSSYILRDYMPDSNEIPDNYKAATGFCYAIYVLNGADKEGNFKGVEKMTRAQAATVLDRVITLKDKTAPNIPAGATALTSLEDKKLIDYSRYSVSGDKWRIYDIGMGTFVCACNGLGASGSGIRFDLKGEYKTLVVTYTSTAPNFTQYVQASAPNPISDYLDGVWLEKGVPVKPGESKTVTINVSGEHIIDLMLGDGAVSDGILSNVYFTK